jgi:caa(3)-type oxidase subunit IV
MADNKHSGHHLVPMSVYYKTLGALVILTILTVGASYMDFGKANIFVSLGIATTKAALVMLFFMGLKYDNNLNRAVILSAFAALFLFIWLSASDLWTRAQPQPIKVAATEALSVDEIKKLEVSTPEQVAKGKNLFALNCAVCHGPNGNGDGPGGVALNPHPRNFHGPMSAWKNGASAKSIFVTLTYGIPGSGMAEYKSIPPRDRWSLAHFIRSMTPEQPATAAADGRYTQALKDSGVGGEGAGRAAIPIDFAIDRMAK